jgi:anaerobic ribonucleoside-triphosphate reductase activating protein
MDRAIDPPPAGAAAQAHAGALRIGGVTPLTTIDYPGALAAVVFVQGCPWRCVYCHNPHLQPRDGATGFAGGWAAFERWLVRRAGLVDAVVFSGGEPTLDPALPAAMAAVRAAGFRVGLHTAGLYPRRLAAVLPAVDWVGFDVKAPLANAAAHDRVTGVAGSTRAPRAALAALRAAGVDFECRTTAHPALLDDAALVAIGASLAAAGVCRYALQVCRPAGAAAPLPAVSAHYPARATLDSLGAMFERFELRRDV